MCGAALFLYSLPMPQSCMLCQIMPLTDTVCGTAEGGASLFRLSTLRSEPVVNSFVGYVTVPVDILAQTCSI